MSKPDSAPPKDAPDAVAETSAPDRLVAEPLVSVLMVAYNHGAYLAEAIEGVLAQRCGFPFELLIGEDCSPDNTRRIALDYQALHPEIIRVVHSATNVGGDANINRIFERARGRYVAYCDGDDYWCAADKLARQVALIEADPAMAVVHTDWVRSRRSGSGWVVAHRSEHWAVPRRLLEGDLFASFHFPKALRACTLLCRRSAVIECMASALAAKKYRFGDTLMAAYLTSRWRVGYVDEVTAVYRESPGSALRSGVQAKLLFLRSALEFDTDARHFFAGRADYPAGYRWEVGVGLLLKAFRAGDGASIRFALADLWTHYGLVGSLRAGVGALALRRRDSSRPANRHVG
jgi:glycosyltransferase involved in cell wall biosynthesis